LRFIFKTGNHDSVRESARQELVARESVRPIWEKNTAISALVLSVVLAVIQIVELLVRLLKP
jgi:hypothetical protein